MPCGRCPARITAVRVGLQRIAACMGTARNSLATGWLRRKDVGARLQNCKIAKSEY